MRHLKLRIFSIAMQLSLALAPLLLSEELPVFTLKIGLPPAGRTAVKREVIISRDDAGEVLVFDADATEFTCSVVDGDALGLPVFFTAMVVDIDGRGNRLTPSPMIRLNVERGATADEFEHGPHLISCELD